MWLSPLLKIQHRRTRSDYAPNKSKRISNEGIGSLDIYLVQLCVQLSCVRGASSRLLDRKSELLSGY